VLQLLVTAIVVVTSPILVTLMEEVIRSSETSVLTRSTRRHIPEDDILHSHRRENLKSYIALTGWTLQWRCNVSPVKYEQGFYIPEDDNLHNHCRENLKSYIALTGWTLQWRCNVSPVKYEQGFYIPEDDNLHSHSRKSSTLTYGVFVYTDRSTSSARQSTGTRLTFYCIRSSVTI
jgi:hypothetical protein